MVKYTKTRVYKAVHIRKLRLSSSHDCLFRNSSPNPNSIQRN